LFVVYNYVNYLTTFTALTESQKKQQKISRRILHRELEAKGNFRPFYRAQW